MLDVDSILHAMSAVLCQAWFYGASVSLSPLLTKLFGMDNSHTSDPYALGKLICFLDTIMSLTQTNHGKLSLSNITDLVSSIPLLVDCTKRAFEHTFSQASINAAFPLYFSVVNAAAGILSCAMSSLVCSCIIVSDF